MSGKNEKARQGVLQLRLDLLGAFTVSLYIFKTHFYQLCHDFENNSSNHIPNYIKQPIKVFENKNCNFFIQRFPALHLNMFVWNVFHNKNLPEIQEKPFISCF